MTKGETMSSVNVKSRRGHSLQFSLRTLMFVMLIVAVCAALIHISAVLAIGTAPFILGALVRTMLVQSHVDASDRSAGTASGLVVTFFRSMLILVGLIFICGATTAAGAVLVSMTIIDRAFIAISRLFQLSAPYARKFLWILWVGFRGLASQIDLGKTLHWIRLQSVTATVWLLSVSRILFRRCIYPAAGQSLHAARAGNLEWL
jgi:hypothetical protein